MFRRITFSILHFPFSIPLLVLLLSRPATAQLIVAANHPDSSTRAFAPGDSILQAQTFIPTTTGILSAVDIPFFTSSPTADLTLQLNTADPKTGLPAALSLASVTLTPDQVTYSTFTSPLYTTFDFSSAALTLTADTPYSLILSTPRPTFLYFVLTSPDTYAAGQAFESDDAGQSFAPLRDPGLDWAFDVTEIPEPSCLSTLVAAALMARPRRPGA
jgi:hypothetical protein